MSATSGYQLGERRDNLGVGEKEVQTIISMMSIKYGRQSLDPSIYPRDGN